MKKVNIFLLLITCTLLVFSVLSSVVIIKLERRTNYIKHYIERRRGVLKTELPPDFWCIQGWSNTLAKMSIDCDICFFGHSQIASSDFRQYFPDKTIVNLGYPGDNLKGMLLRVEQIGFVKPEKVFIMGGVNSLGYSQEEFEDSYDELIKSIRNEVPQAELYIFNILPQCNGRYGNVTNNELIRKRNEYILQYAMSEGIELIDLYSIYSDNEGNLIDSYSIDGLHLKSNAYDIWADSLIPFICN